MPADDPTLPVRHSRVPTEKQAGRLQILASGCTALAPGRGAWGPLLRRGWVAPVSPDDKDKRFLPPLEITPDGLRALADHLERHPRPPWNEREKPQQLDESPRVERLKMELREVKAARDDAERTAQWYRQRLARIGSALAGWDAR